MGKRGKTPCELSKYQVSRKRIQSYFVRERLLEHDSPIAAYQKGGMIKAEIDGILAAEFCQDLLAPVVDAFENEKARIFAETR